MDDDWRAMLFDSIPDTGARDTAAATLMKFTLFPWIHNIPPRLVTVWHSLWPTYFSASSLNWWWGREEICISQYQLSVRAATTVNKTQILLFSDVGMFDRASKFVIEILSKLISNCAGWWKYKTRGCVQAYIFVAVWLSMSSSYRERQILETKRRKIWSKAQILNLKAELVVANLIAIYDFIFLKRSIECFQNSIKVYVWMDIEHTTCSFRIQHKFLPQSAQQPYR